MNSVPDENVLTEKQLLRLIKAKRSQSKYQYRLRKHFAQVHLVAIANELKRKADRCAKETAVS